MIAYVDSSVLLRLALGLPNALPERRRIDRGVSSALISTESLRSLDRVRIRAGLSDAEVASRRVTKLNLIDSFELIEIDSLVLDRAAQPMPTELGTLCCRLIARSATPRIPSGRERSVHGKARRPAPRAISRRRAT
jgi:hypothetical protein